eukprot:SAG11_NODE_22788_length_400_cov_0.780731_1_plen_30_part_01
MRRVRLFCYCDITRVLMFNRRYALYDCYVD